jgi:hypothetical protein
MIDFRARYKTPGVHAEGATTIRKTTRSTVRISTTMPTGDQQFQTGCSSTDSE